MSLTDLYDLSLRGRHSTPALDADDPVHGVRHFTFGDLDARSDRLAGVLAARGVVPGDRLSFCLANSTAVIDLWLAAMKLGVIVVPVNVLYRGREIAHILSDAEPRAVVTTADRLADFGERAWDVDVLIHEADQTPAPRPATRLDAASPAALVYTSGTTGVAKGAVLTHGNFAANALALVAAWEITASDRYLAALPLFHVHGLGNGVQCWLVSGCHMRLLERFEHEKALDWFEQ